MNLLCFCIIIVLLFVICLTQDGQYFYTQEDIEWRPPTYLELVKMKDTNVVLRWEYDPCNNSAYKSFFIKIWNQHYNETYTIQVEVTAVEIPFFPNSRNYVTVSIAESGYVGPPSNVVIFDAPPIHPRPPQLLHAYQLGSKSLMLKWMKMLVPVENIIGYKVFYGEKNLTSFGDSITMSVEIQDPSKEQLKLTGLSKNNYIIAICCVNDSGQSNMVEIEKKIEHHNSSKPATPSFTWKLYLSELKNNETIQHKPVLSSTNLSTVVTVEPNSECPNSSSAQTSPSNIKLPVICKITWLPNFEDGNPGENFYVKYRLRGEMKFHTTTTETRNDFVVIHNLTPCEIYEVVVVSVDGIFNTPSEIQYVATLM